MQIFTDVTGVREFSRSCQRNGKTVGFVPTMGYLHQGHLSLVKIAKRHADIVIASLYMNPTQFAAHEDFDDYPVSKEEDRRKLEGLGCDAVFEPKSLYATDGNDDTVFIVGNEQNSGGIYQTFVRAEHLETLLCGQTRPHFFRGVATAVTKLFNIVEPNIAVFGMKDYQQLQIVKTLTKELNFDIKIIGGPIIREDDGLAMSSRNALIHPDARPNCPMIFQSLQWAEAKLKAQGFANSSPNDLIDEIKDRISVKGGKVDYVKIVDPSSLQDLSKLDTEVIVIAIAVFFPSKHKGATVRLIDNIEIHHM